ncbi:MAG: hypothetical protein ACTSUE_16615 [Promethearchaeota archaeon]
MLSITSMPWLNTNGEIRKCGIDQTRSFNQSDAGKIGFTVTYAAY